MQAVGKGLKYLFVLSLLALPVLAWWQYQAIEDWVKLRGYNPPVEVVALADETAMTDAARHIFYVNRPLLLDDVDSFRQNCSQAEQTIVLGCYHSSQEGIAIYNVQNQQLEGVEEVTAAHEMLHAAYDRLDRSEKERINSLLNDFAQTIEDKRILETINQYKQTEPDSVVDEMHSIFGTEILKLPPSLEEHYRDFFTDRNAVVELAQDYEQEFSDRMQQIEDYDEQLEPMRQSIQQEEQRLSAEFSSLEQARQQINSPADAAAFNARVNAYNQAVQSLRSDIETFNALIEQRNALARELGDLSSAIDTRLAPQSEQ